jgi:hypothetical protein
MNPPYDHRTTFTALAVVVLSMLLFSCAGNREYAHYRWKGQSPQKHTAKAEAPEELPQASQTEKHRTPKESSIIDATSPEAHGGPQIQESSASKAAKKRQITSIPQRSFPGLQPNRFENPMDVLLQSLGEDQISALEENQVAEDSLLWWGLVLCGIGLILLLLAGILGAGNGFVLAWLFWAIGSIALAAGLILLLIYLLKMV